MMYKKIKFAEAIKGWIDLDVSSSNILKIVNEIGVDGFTVSLSDAAKMVFTSPTGEEMMTIQRSFFNAGKFSLQIEGHPVFYGETSNPDVIKFFQSIVTNPRVMDFLYIELLISDVITFNDLVSYSPLSDLIVYSGKEHKIIYDKEDRDENNVDFWLNFANERELNHYEEFGENSHMYWKLLDFSEDREGSLTVHESRERYNPLIGAMFLAGID